MTRHLVTSALFAGVVAGLFAALLQFWLVTPLLLEGELYESGIRIHGAASHDPAASIPSLDLPRNLLTVGFNIVAFTAYALILLAFMAFSELRGHAVTPRQGVLWGLAGFLVLQLAPAIGLPPELPGTIAADLVARQIWWLATVVASGLGIALIAFARSPARWLIGLVLLAAPHIIGAPQLDTYSGVAPPELSALFATRSLGVAAASWVVLGFLAAYFRTRTRTA